MKKILLIIGLLCSFLVNAQTAPDDDFTRMVSQNKIWKPVCYNMGYSAPSCWDGDVTYLFDGFVEKNGKRYSRLVLDKDREFTVALMREEGGRVYFLMDDNFINYFHVSGKDLELKDTEVVQYDFNLKQGDKIDMFLPGNGMNTRTIGKTFTADLKGHKVRMQEILYEDGVPAPVDNNYVVEGIGPFSSICLLFVQDYIMACNQTIMTLNHVEDKNTGEELINEKDIEKAILTAKVKEVSDGGGVKDGKIYDIMGREVKNPQPGSVYIQNGRKFVAR